MITQRRASLVVIGLMFAGTLLILLIQMVAGDKRDGYATTAIAAAGFAGLLYAYWRGWEPARQVLIAFVTLVVALRANVDIISFSVMIPPILALLMTNSWWVAGSSALIALGLILRSPAGGVYTNVIDMVMYGLCVGALMLTRFVLDNARLSAEANTRHAEAAFETSEQQRQDLLSQSSLLHEQNIEQQRLLDLVATLELPTVELAQGLLLVPIVGTIDSRRAQQLTERILETVHSRRTQQVILDIVGVPEVDTLVARALLNTANALRLLGCKVTITGISPEVAVSLTHLDVNMNHLVTKRSPQEVLVQYLS